MEDGLTFVTTPGDVVRLKLVSDERVRDHVDVWVDYDSFGMWISAISLV